MVWVYQKLPQFIKRISKDLFMKSALGMLIWLKPQESSLWCLTMATSRLAAWFGAQLSNLVSSDLFKCTLRALNGHQKRSFKPKKLPVFNPANPLVCVLYHLVGRYTRQLCNLLFDRLKIPDQIEALLFDLNRFNSNTPRLL